MQKSSTPTAPLAADEGRRRAMLKKKFSPGCAHTKVSPATPAAEGWNTHNSQAALILYIQNARAKYTRAQTGNRLFGETYNNSVRCAARSAATAEAKIAFNLIPYSRLLLAFAFADALSQNSIWQNVNTPPPKLTTQRQLRNVFFLSLFVCILLPACAQQFEW
jgi:hypothetical protein